MKLLNYSILFFRLLDGAIPSDLLTTHEDENRITFPENMRDDLINTAFQVDIDILPPPPQELQLPVRNPNRERGGWIEAPEDDGQQNGKSSMNKKESDI